ncbi:UNVERIFIED_CONTAM: hypothetical protein NCL1_47740 [Trichonephila clavipes]
MSFHFFSHVITSLGTFCWRVNLNEGHTKNIYDVNLNERIKKTYFAAASDIFVQNCHIKAKELV